MTASGNQIFAFWAGYVVEQAMNWLLGAKQKLARPRNVLMLLLVVSAFASSFVDAQPAAAPGLDAGSIVPRISEAVDTALNRLGEGTLNSMGATIAAFFLVALMVWTALKTMAGGKGLGDLIGEWVPIWVSFAFVYAFLNQAGAAAITGTMDAIATAIGGANMSTLSSAIDVVARPVLGAIVEVASMPLVSDAEFFSPSTWVPALAANLGTLITKLITVVFLLVVDIRKEKVILVAATNHIDRLDGAGIREGRFDFKVEITPPDREARVGLLTHGLKTQLPKVGVDAAVVEAALSAPRRLTTTAPGVTHK